MVRSVHPNSTRVTMKSVGHKQLLAMVQRFQRRKEYVDLKKSCQLAVVKWRWATSLMLPQLPYDHVVSGSKRPRWTKKQPSSGSLHGIDADGRIRWIRDDYPNDPDERTYEQFLIHEGNGFWCIYFGNDAKNLLLQLKWIEMDGDRWLCSLEIGQHGARECVLHWDRNRLVKHTEHDWSGISIRNPKAAAAKLRKKSRFQTIHSYTYAADGELERVVKGVDIGDGDPPRLSVEYQRIPKGVTLNLLLRQAEDLLVAEIPKTLKAAKVREKAYSLLLQYTGVDTDPDGFAPPMFLAFESLRQRLLSDHWSDAGRHLWAIPEWEGDPAVVTVSCKNAVLDEKLHLIFQLTIVKSSKYGPVRKMFQRVCARLNALDWKGILKTTDDFVVLPFDTHDEFDRKTDLKASVPTEKIRLLMSRGYLPRMKI